MAEKELILKEKVQSAGIFSYSGYYSFAYAWLRYEDYDVIEEEYIESVSGNEKDITIKWKAWKQLSDYFKIEHAIKTEVRGMSDVEVEIDGVKKKMNKGKITVEIKGSMVRDPDSEWHGGWGWRFFRGVYDKYVIPGRIKEMRDKIREEVRLFKEQLKSYLELSGRR